MRSSLPGLGLPGLGPSRTRTFSDSDVPELAILVAWSPLRSILYCTSQGHSFLFDFFRSLTWHEWETTRQDKDNDCGSIQQHCFVFSTFTIYQLMSCSCFVDIPLSLTLSLHPLFCFFLSFLLIINIIPRYLYLSLSHSLSLSLSIYFPLNLSQPHTFSSSLTAT